MDRYPIVILHGWNLSGAKFSLLGEEFIKQGYKVYCPDLPGFGSSEILDKPFTLSDYVSFIEDFIKEKKLDRVIVVGHSFGGRIGIKLAMKRPTLLRALILSGVPGISPVPRHKRLFFLVLAKIGKIVFTLPVFSYFSQIAKKLIYKLADASDYYYTDEKMKKTFKNVVRENLVPYLSHISTPTLFLWGEEDKIVPVGIAQKMKNIIRDSKLIVIPNARHGLPWTHPELFVNEVEEFLSGI